MLVVNHLHSFAVTNNRQIDFASTLTSSSEVDLKLLTQ